MTNATLVKVPFDLERWQQVAAEEYPNGLPEPHSDDPTQWLFKGHPKGSTDPLQVAVARLLGYRWPDQEPDDLDPTPKSCGTAAPGCHDSQKNPAEGGWATLKPSTESCGTAAPGCHDSQKNPAEGGWATLKPSTESCGTAALGCHDTQKNPAEGGWATSRPSLIDADGIVSIPAVRGESPAADRLHDVLRRAFGSEWSTSLENKLLTETGARPGTSLDDWLRDAFFELHCKRFHNRPYVWHLWDGRKDGFACLVNYHKFDHKRLETLTYSYVQDWINAQAAAAKTSKTGADLRLAAAQQMQDKLKLILAGEPPYDLFVRWKPLADQPIGWNPDLNDGVRLNIRPFMTAGLLRKNPNIKWTKDRGTEPKRDKDQFPWFWDGDTFKGERVNDRHYPTADKLAARSQKIGIH